ncbi:MAG: DUF4388 domain-containing protein [candidate division Zixibacteria bacterium]|nr:DUF4388 domain-containing protein [candidate division Zixibacteria bacterium]
MSNSTERPRLDQILVNDRIVSEVQIREALLRQKAHGGKLGSQLLYHRNIDETSLVKSLATQFGCEGVVLSNLEIPELILKFIPSKVARVRKVIPFDYNPEENLLKIACEDPTDQSLINELHFIARSKEIKLYVAAELALNTSIAKHYFGRNVSLDDNLLLEIPDDATESGHIPIIESNGDDTGEVPSQSSVLLVTDEEYSGPLLQSLLERDNYQITITDSADDAIEMIGGKTFHTVFIKDSVPGDYIDLIDRLRKSSPRTTVRYYESASSLLINPDAVVTEESLLVKNMELFTSLLSLKDSLPINHSGAVGQYVGKLCHRLGLPGKDRLLITNAAYIHDLARYYYHTDDREEPHSLVRMTRKLLASLNYSPVVIEMLRSMYKDLGGKYTKRLPIEILGGNILTTVDMFCESVDPNERLSLDRLEAIKKKYRDLSGKLFLSEVAEAFTTMIQEEILQSQSAAKPCQVMIYGDNVGILYPLEHRLKNEGFRTVSQTSRESFVELYKRSQPDVMILLLEGTIKSVTVFIDKLEDKGVAFDQTPTFLFVDGPSNPEMRVLFKRGFADVVPPDVNVDLLLSKLIEIQSAIQAKEKQQLENADSTSGTSGLLTDMNLIDLIQALGPSQKTTRITIRRSDSDDDELVICLNNGKIIFAQLGEQTGAEAVYKGITWSEGTWTIQPLSPDDLPRSNNELSNESILMEGCRLQDEKVRAGQLL